MYQHVNSIIIEQGPYRNLSHDSGDGALTFAIAELQVTLAYANETLRTALDALAVAALVAPRAAAKYPDVIAERKRLVGIQAIADDKPAKARKSAFVRLMAAPA